LPSGVIAYGGLFGDITIVDPGEVKRCEIAHDGQASIQCLWCPRGQLGLTSPMATF
jgi:hypothetical protein